MVLGMDVTKSKQAIVRRIGVLPQGFSSFDRITVRETIQYYGRLFGGRRLDVDGLMALVNLTEKAGELYKNLSGGLKQRLGIAIALVNDPEVLFLDEPTTGLDPKARREVWEVLKGLKRQGKTVLLTTHYMEEAELLADRVAIISRGKIIALDSPAALIKKNASPPLLTLEVGGGRGLEILRGMGFHPVPGSGHDLNVAVKQTEDVRQILNALKDGGATCCALGMRRSNLEEVFLKLTGEALHDGLPLNRG
jgi:ABC-2 type transport system ATP-binding protein